MRTGEGKTLVSTCPAYLNALKGKGVQIVTVNDYLAKRDAEWMGQVHRFLGLTVGVVLNDMNSAQDVYKRQALQRTLRDARMRELLMEKHGEIDVDYIKCCMADHVNYPQSLCRHPPIPTQPLMMRTITVSNEIVDFEAGVVHILSLIHI